MVGSGDSVFRGDRLQFPGSRRVKTGKNPRSIQKKDQQFLCNNLITKSLICISLLSISLFSICFEITFINVSQMFNAYCLRPGTDHMLIILPSLTFQ